MVFLAYVLPSQSDLMLYHKKAKCRFIVSIAVCSAYVVSVASQLHITVHMYASLKSCPGVRVSLSKD